MVKKVYKKIARTPSHAGEVLKSGFIDQYELSIVTVSELLGMTREHLSRIINGHIPVTSDVAAKLEILTKMPASQWLSLQAQYDVYIMRQDAEFRKYEAMLENWVSDSLPLSTAERRSDKEITALGEKVAAFAKRFSRKKRLAH